MPYLHWGQWNSSRSESEPSRAISRLDPGDTDSARGAVTIRLSGLSHPTARDDPGRSTRQPGLSLTIEGHGRQTHSCRPDPGGGRVARSRPRVTEFGQPCGGWSDEGKGVPPSLGPCARDSAAFSGCALTTGIVSRSGLSNSSRPTTRTRSGSPSRRMIEPSPRLVVVDLGRAGFVPPVVMRGSRHAPEVPPPSQDTGVSSSAASVHLSPPAATIRRPSPTLATRTRASRGRVQKMTAGAGWAVTPKKWLC